MSRNNEEIEVFGYGTVLERNEKVMPVSEFLGRYEDAGDGTGRVKEISLRIAAEADKQERGWRPTDLLKPWRW